MATPTITLTRPAAIRLWDINMTLIASDQCVPEIEAEGITVKVNGKGSLYAAACNALTNGLIGDATIHLTIDPDPANLTWTTHIGAIVKSIDVEERRCECGNPIITTTIHAVPRTPLGIW